MSNRLGRWLISKKLECFYVKWTTGRVSLYSSHASPYPPSRQHVLSVKVLTAL
jgi:hypothetical protein